MGCYLIKRNAGTRQDSNFVDDRKFKFKSKYHHASFIAWEIVKLCKKPLKCVLFDERRGGNFKRLWARHQLSTRLISHVTFQFLHAVLKEIKYMLFLLEFDLHLKF